MSDRQKGKYIGMLGALLVHVAIIVLLVLVGFTIPEKMEESGVEIMMGNVESAYGGFDPASLVEVDVVPQPAAGAEPAPSLEQDMLTQTEEETVVIESKKAEETKKPEKTEAEKAAEARRLAEEKAERERRAAAEAANKLVAGAFGKGAQMGNRGTATTGEGIQGAPTGTAPTGSTTGNGGYGTFDLGGRSIGEGGLPRPQYNVQEEGRVVVTITVNPAGYVIGTSINMQQTNTVNATLRKAAEDAAKKARFNAVEGLNNQTGTITYYFNLR
ncbi:cell envelope integrity protein TolA [Bacteroides sp. OttesenSCG-928-E20]|nr:cell envelope integrity protein TolA [Bacteroides sp. OttesenSCG-928-E20]MDL2305042.1 cell envelope integrity protein TolA [Bacteroides sp. OttesenSCG-928-D19]